MTDHEKAALIEASAAVVVAWIETPPDDIPPSWSRTCVVVTEAVEFLIRKFKEAADA